MIKAVIFDCFGVLTTDLWRAFCDNLPPGEGLERAHELNHAFDRGFISLEEFLEGVEEATGQKPPDLEAMGNSAINKNHALLKRIVTLKQQGYKIGLLSNISDDWITDHFLDKEEQDLFDTIVVSHEVGMTKPSEGIFRLIAERLDVDVSEAVLIDDVESYCQGARNIGMPAICYGSLQQCLDELDTLLSQSE